MTTHEVRQIGVTIAVPLARAYAFACQPESFARWATGLGDGLRQVDGRWVVATPAGEATISFSAPNDYGVLDHTVQLPGKPPIDVPLRMVANGDGTEVTLTLFRQPDMNDAAFDHDAALVAADFERLRDLLEGGAE